jgi:hypothetical protein
VWERERERERERKMERRGNQNKTHLARLERDIVYVARDGANTWQR